MAWGVVAPRCRQAGRQADRSVVLPCRKKGRCDSQPKPKAKSQKLAQRSAAGPALENSQMGVLAKTQEGEDKDKTINGLAMRRRISARRPVALLWCCLMFFCLRLPSSQLGACWELGLGVCGGGENGTGEVHGYGSSARLAESLTQVGDRFQVGDQSPVLGRFAATAGSRVVDKGRQRENADGQEKEKETHTWREANSARGV